MAKPSALCRDRRWPGHSCGICRVERVLGRRGGSRWCPSLRKLDRSHRLNQVAPVVRTRERTPIGFANRNPWIKSKPSSRAIRKSASVSTPTATESHALEPDVIGEFTRHRQVARYIATVDFDD